MDAVIAALLWPFVTVFQYLRFVLGTLIALPFLIATRPKRHFDLVSVLAPLPLGIYVFSGIIGFYAPYSATIAATVLELNPKKCVVTFGDWPWLRNPFSSVHAVALANAGELSSGLLMVSALQKTKLRAIPNSISTTYLKKARGTIKAVSEAVTLEEGKTKDVEVSASLYDSKGVLVAVTKVCWAVSPR